MMGTGALLLVVFVSSTILPCMMMRLIFKALCSRS
jgi:hypothetical protein